MYQALYRTERPEVFSEVLGQEHIVHILKNQIKTDTVGHAYLFCGTRGTGKTTMARLLAKAVNCTGEGERPCGVCENCRAIAGGAFVDMIEIDAASNNGVDNVRELRESVKYPPAVGRRKVYVIDEAHMLTVPAFNALLKTLEEPPENVMFILATTDPQRIPQTILSRCMRFDFRRVPRQAIEGRMKRICESRGVEASDEALALLAANADGAVRDALSLLDQCLSGGEKKIERDTVLEYLGTAPTEFFLELTDRVLAGDAAGALLVLDRMLRGGKDVKQLIGEWLAHYRALLIAKYVDDPADLLNMSEENLAAVREQSGRAGLPHIGRAIETIARTAADAKYSTQPRVLMELATVTLAKEAYPGHAPEKGAPEKGAPKAPRRPGTGLRSDVRGGAESETAPGAGPETAPGAGPSAASEPSLKSVTEGGPPAEGPEEREYEAGELAELWEQAWDQVEDDGSSIFLARINTTLAGIRGDEFKVICSNDFVKGIADKNRSAITLAMSRVLGRSMRMILRDAAEAAPEGRGAGDEAENRRKCENMANEVAEKFGIKARVE